VRPLQIRGGRRRGRSSSWAAWCVEENGCALVPSFLIPSAVPFRRTPCVARPRSLKRPIPSVSHPFVALGLPSPPIAPAISNCLKRTRVAARISVVFAFVPELRGRFSGEFVVDKMATTGAVVMGGSIAAASVAVSSQSHKAQHSSGAAQQSLFWGERSKVARFTRASVSTRFVKIKILN
jgi:hypothetical protein